MLACRTSPPWPLRNGSPRLFLASMSMARNWSALLAWRSFRCWVCVLFDVLRVHSWQSVTVVCMSLAVCGQYLGVTWCRRRCVLLDVQLFGGNDTRIKTELVMNAGRLPMSLHPSEPWRIRICYNCMFSRSPVCKMLMLIGSTVGLRFAGRETSLLKAWYVGLM